MARGDGAHTERRHNSKHPRFQPPLLQRAFSPVLAGADTTPPLRLAPSTLASPPLSIAPRAAMPASLLRGGPQPPPSSVADLLDSPYSLIGDDGEVAARTTASPGVSSSASIPAHWPSAEAQAAAAAAFGGGAPGPGGPLPAPRLLPFFPAKSVVARAPTPEEAASDPAAGAALQAEVRRALVGVGVRVPLYSSRRAGGGGGGVQQQAQQAVEAPAVTPTPTTAGRTRRLTALEAVLGGLGLGTPGGWGRRGGGGA